MAAVEPRRAPDPAQRRSDLSLCVTLLSLFDFSAQGCVTRDDWTRGLSTLLLGGLSEDEGLWQRLLEMYDAQKTGTVQLEKVRDVLRMHHDEDFLDGTEKGPWRQVHDGFSALKAR